LGTLGVCKKLYKNINEKRQIENELVKKKVEHVVKLAGKKIIKEFVAGFNKLFILF